MFKERVWPGKKSETSNLKIEEAGSWLKAVSIDDKRLLPHHLFFRQTCFLSSSVELSLQAGAEEPPRLSGEALLELLVAQLQLVELLTVVAAHGAAHPVGI